jgi:hypothetical protein
MRDDGHLERLGPPRHFLANPAQSGQAEHLAADLLAQETLLVPLALFHGRVGRRELAGERQELRHGQFGNADGICARRVHHDNAARAGRLDIDVVDAGSGAGDGTKFLAGGNDVRRHLRRAAHDERICIRKIP